jgi:hypothetical protein
VKILFLFVGGLYVIAFAGQYLKTHYVDPPPVLPKLLEELREFRDLEREEIGNGRLELTPFRHRGFDPPMRFKAPLVLVLPSCAIVVDGSRH